MTRAFTIAASFAIALVTACTPPPPPDRGAAIGQAESARLSPVVDKLKKAGVVTGFDVSGNQLTISVDAERWSEQDEVAEDQLKSDLLARWSAIWRANHPRGHARVRVRFQNYYGEEIATMEKAV